MQELIKAGLYLLTLFITYLVTVLSNQLIKYIREKVKNEKVSLTLEKVSSVVFESVECIAQTYVDDIKKKNVFDANAQKEAFNLALEKVKSLLTVEAQEIIKSVYGNVEEYLKTKIESTVKVLKTA